MSAQVDGLGEETAVDDAARPPVNRIVRDLDKFPTLSGETVVNGDSAPVLCTAEHVADQVRFRGDLFVDVVRGEGFEIVASSEYRPRDA